MTGCIPMTPGPYIVTHRGLGSPAITNSASPEPGEPDRVLYREAFATLEDAVRSILRKQWEDLSILAVHQVRSLTASGSITLPAGTRIEVEATERERLVDELRERGVEVHDDAALDAICVFWTRVFGASQQFFERKESA